MSVEYCWRWVWALNVFSLLALVSKNFFSFSSSLFDVVCSVSYASLCILFRAADTRHAYVSYLNNLLTWVTHSEITVGVLRRLESSFPSLSASPLIMFLLFCSYSSFVNTSCMRFFYRGIIASSRGFWTFSAYFSWLVTALLSCMTSITNVEVVDLAIFSVLQLPFLLLVWMHILFGRAINGPRPPAW